MAKAGRSLGQPTAESNLQGAAWQQAEPGSLQSHHFRATPTLCTAEPQSAVARVRGSSTRWCEGGWSQGCVVRVRPHSTGWKRERPSQNDPGSACCQLTPWRSASAVGCPRLRPASATQPLGRLWPRPRSHRARFRHIAARPPPAPSATPHPGPSPNPSPNPSQGAQPPSARPTTPNPGPSPHP